MFSNQCDTWIKLSYYIILTGYHVADCFFDWRVYLVLKNDKMFAGVPYDSPFVEEFFLVSCCCGSLLGFAMIIIYGYYIKFHFSSLYHISADLSAHSNPKSQSKFSWKCHGCRHKPNCNRHYVLPEFIVSLLELSLKDDIQGGVLFGLTITKRLLPPPDNLSLVFAVCSVFAHMKLFISFITKLCGLGVGEGDWQEVPVIQSVLCVIGCIGSFVLLIFTLLYFVKVYSVNASACLRSKTPFYRGTVGLHN